MVAAWPATALTAWYNDAMGFTDWFAAEAGVVALVTVIGSAPTGFCIGGTGKPAIVSAMELARGVPAVVESSIPAMPSMSMLLSVSDRRVRLVVDSD